MEDPSHLFSFWGCWQSLAGRCIPPGFPGFPPDPCALLERTLTGFRPALIHCDLILSLLNDTSKHPSRSGPTLSFWVDMNFGRIFI